MKTPQLSFVEPGADISKNLSFPLQVHHKGRKTTSIATGSYRKALVVHHETIQYGALLSHDG